MQKVHFISGLTQSGSTLLATILNQNGQIHAAKNRLVAALINGCQEQIGAGREFYSFFDENKRKVVCKALFSAYYENSSKEIIFETNRVWTAQLLQLTERYDEFKVVCLVRNPACIMDSFEKIYRKNPFDMVGFFSQETEQPLIRDAKVC